ncbi:hypothetical protein AZ19_3383, partial [Bordetella bronchiseptica E012]
MSAARMPANAMSADPSDSSHLVETLVSSETLCDGGFLKARRDTVRLPSGRAATREYIVHPGAVVVVPLLDDGRVLLDHHGFNHFPLAILDFVDGDRDFLEVALGVVGNMFAGGALAR